MVIRKESWGQIEYDTKEHQFTYSHDDIDLIPYSHDPVLLNIYLTMKCNMTCDHCVTRDFQNQQDLLVSYKAINFINNSKFMVIVITGGEPLLPDYENKLLTLLNKIKNKGLIIDTNGINKLSSTLIHSIIDKNVLVRVSLDTHRVWEEIYYRHLLPNKKENSPANERCFYEKLDNIRLMLSNGIKVAIQSVVNTKNLGSIDGLLPLLEEYGIKKWYLQRFIPSYKSSSKTHNLDINKFNDIVKKLSVDCKSRGIECIAKKDRRHNSVIMMIGDGELFTQSEQPGIKVRLGNINEEINFFNYVSAADHAERYYGT